TTRYRRTTRSGSGSGYACDRGRGRRTAARSAPHLQAKASAGSSSRTPRQQPGGPDEHHDDEEGEGQHVAPFEIGEQPAERDDLGEHERRHKTADEIAEPAEHTD